MNQILKALAILLVMQYGQTFKARAQIVVDTLGWESYHEGTETLYQSPNGGFVFGNNGYGDRIKARVFESPIVGTYGLQPFGKVTKVLLKVGVKIQTSGNPDSRLVVRMYKVGGNGFNTSGSATNAPSTEFVDIDGADTTYLTAPVYMDDIDANGITVVELTSGVEADTYYRSFAVGLDVSQLAPGDTIGLYSTTDGDAGGAETAWDLTQNFGWVTVLSSEFGWALDADPAIFSVFEYESSTVSIAEQSDDNLKVFPNPASESVYVANSGEGWDSISIFDLSGKLVKSCTNQTNVMRIELSVQELESGMYIMYARGSERFASAKIQVHR